MWERAVTKMNILWGQLLANLKKDEKERDRKYKKEVMHLLRPQRFRGNNEVHEGESSRNSVEERNSSEEADAGESDVEVDDGKEMQTGVRRFEFFERWPIIGRWVKLHHARVAHEELALVFEMNRAFLKAQEVLRHASGDEHHGDHGPAHAKSHESKELWNFVGAKMRASRHSTSLGGLAAQSVKRNETMERSAAFKEALLREIKKREKLEKKIATNLKKIEKANPSVSRAVQTRYMAALLLRKQDHVVEEMQHHGELTVADAMEMKKKIHDRLMKLYFTRTMDLGRPDHGPVWTRIFICEIACFKFLHSGDEDAAEGHAEGGKTAGWSDRKDILEKLIAAAKHDDKGDHPDGHLPALEPFRALTDAVTDAFRPSQDRRATSQASASGALPAVGSGENTGCSTAESTCRGGSTSVSSRKPSDASGRKASSVKGSRRRSSEESSWDQLIIVKKGHILVTIPKGDGPPGLPQLSGNTSMASLSGVLPGVSEEAVSFPVKQGKMYGIKEVLLHSDFGAKIDRSKACVIDIPGSVVREIIKTRSDAARDIELGLWHMLAYNEAKSVVRVQPAFKDKPKQEIREYVMRGYLHRFRAPTAPPRRPTELDPELNPDIAPRGDTPPAPEAIPELGLISDSPVMTRKGAEADYDPAKFDARTGVAKLGQVTMKGPNGVPRDEDRWFSIVLIHGRVDGLGDSPPPTRRSAAAEGSLSRVTAQRISSRQPDGAWGEPADAPQFIKSGDLVEVAPPFIDALSAGAIYQGDDPVASAKQAWVLALPELPSAPKASWEFEDALRKLTRELKACGSERCDYLYRGCLEVTRALRPADPIPRSLSPRVPSISGGTCYSPTMRTRRTRRRRRWRSERRRGR